MQFETQQSLFAHQLIKCVRVCVHVLLRFGAPNASVPYRVIFHLIQQWQQHQMHLQIFYGSRFHTSNERETMAHENETEKKMRMEKKPLKCECIDRLLFAFH